MRAFQIYGCTDRGTIRPLNEDHILVGRFIKNRGGLGMYLAHDDDFIENYGLLFAVADGIGGENAGEVASKMALTAFERQFYRIEKRGHDKEAFLNAISASAKRANDTILQIAASKSDLSGMGCTISGVCITSSGFLVFNAGDSRIYRYRNGFLTLLTKDDTVTNLAVQLGRMGYEDAQRSDARHTLTNSLGSQSFYLKVETGPEIRDNDIILICSDGLHDLVEQDSLEGLIGKNGTVEDIANRLLQQAIQNGGHDNVSIILIRSDVIESEGEKGGQKK
jgi:protein phosphatase